MIIFAGIQVFLLISSLILFIPHSLFKKNILSIIHLVQQRIHYFLIILFVVIFQIIEVNFIDLWSTDIIGIDFADFFYSIEQSLVANLHVIWHPLPLSFFVIMYIIVYPFILWFSPMYYLVIDEKKPIKTLAYGLLIIFGLALPFYLFFPVTNVYTYFHIPSALNSVFPNIESFFYHTTTSNNCFPSLHVAVSIILMYSASYTKNKKYYYFTFFSMIMIMIAVLYLVIHWIIDFIGGILISIIAIFIIKHLILEKRNHE
jgi:PAP2 superfamily protein